VTLESFSSVGQKSITLPLDRRNLAFKILTNPQGNQVFSIPSLDRFSPQNNTAVARRTENGKQTQNRMKLKNNKISH
jgi:hypothetical protein